MLFSRLVLSLCSAALLTNLAAAESCNDAFVSSIMSATDSVAKCDAAMQLVECVGSSNLQGDALSAAKTSAANSKAIVLAQEDCTAVLRRAGEGTAQVRTVDGSIVLSVGSAKDITFDRQGDDKNPTSIFSLVSVTVCVFLEYTYTHMHTHSVLPASVKVRTYVGPRDLPRETRNSSSNFAL